MPSTPAPCGGPAWWPPVTEPEDPAGGIIFYRPGGGARSPRAVNTNHVTRPVTTAGPDGWPGSRFTTASDSSAVIRARSARWRGRPRQMRAVFPAGMYRQTGKRSRRSGGVEPVELVQQRIQ